MRFKRWRRLKRRVYRAADTWLLSIVCYYFLKGHTVSYRLNVWKPYSCNNNRYRIILYIYIYIYTFRADVLYVFVVYTARGIWRERQTERDREREKTTKQFYPLVRRRAGKFVYGERMCLLSRVIICISVGTCVHLYVYFIHV